MRRFAAVAVAVSLLLAPASLAATASHRLVGMVPPVVGVAIDAQGSVTGANGSTLDVTVRRERTGDRTVITVIPR